MKKPCKSEDFGWSTVERCQATFVLRGSSGPPPTLVMEACSPFPLLTLEYSTKSPSLTTFVV